MRSQACCYGFTTEIQRYVCLVQQKNIHWLNAWEFSPADCFERAVVCEWLLEDVSVQSPWEIVLCYNAKKKFPGSAYPINIPFLFEKSFVGRSQLGGTLVMLFYNLRKKAIGYSKGVFTLNFNINFGLRQHHCYQNVNLTAVHTDESSYIPHRPQFLMK